MHLLVWLLVGVVFALWSLLMWGVHALLTIDPSWVGDLEPLVERLPLGAWIEPWLPAWRELLGMTVDVVQWLLGAVGTAAPVVLWVVWGGGALAMLALAALASLLVGGSRRIAHAAAGRPAG